MPLQPFSYTFSVELVMAAQRCRVVAIFKHVEARAARSLMLMWHAFSYHRWTSYTKIDRLMIIRVLSVISELVAIFIILLIEDLQIRAL